jgi:2-keto-myo-inositol isomerase
MYKAFSPQAIGFSVPFEEAVEAAARNGFEGYWFDLRGDLQRGVAFVREKLAATGMKPAGFGLPVDFRRDKQRFEEDMKGLGAVARAAGELGLERCTTWLAPASDELTYEENFELHRDRLNRVAGLLGDHGIRLGLEFVGPPSFRAGRRYQFVCTLQSTIELCGAIGRDNVGLLLDLFHWDTARQSEGDFRLIPSEEFIVLVHLNDAPAGRAIEEQLDNDRRLPGETGVLAAAPFLKGVTGLGYTGPVVVEPFSAALKAMSFDDAVAATKASLDRVWMG